MPPKPPLKLGYALLAAQGALSVLAPRKAIELVTSVWRLGFENVGDLEPREWYVELTRVVGVGMLAAGLTGLLVHAARDDAEQATREATSEPEETDSPDEDGPVQVDID